ncbi:restriction modification system DNA specificity subunit [Helicobacter pylori Puno120]|uniref:restriction endonuclease subunit S n=1 Tax=Helicobacter pylori TaxID=210 RepID=UPI0002290E94|nr:restriction endonuclease subunit S [Helicobacter pylori]AEN16086.1 restriction modification system DNA specificity subunit [Helicobacter pylori Puno120]
MNTLTAFYDLPKEWEVVRLLDIAHIFDGTHQTPQYTHHGVAFFSVENIANNKPNKFISQQDYLIATSKNKPEYNDILLTRIGAIGISKVVSWTYPFSIYVTLAVIKQSKYFNSYYLHYFIQSSFFQKELKDNSLLQAIPCKINMDKLKKCKVILPPLNEQIAIANILSALDRYLCALDALILKKEGVKKALRIKMLNQILASNGVEFKKIGEICLIKRGRVIAKKILQENGKYPVYSSQTLNNGVLGFIDTYDFDGEFLTWTTDGAYAGSVFYRNGRFSITNVCGLLQVIQDNILHKYLYYILQITAPLHVNPGMGNPKLMSAAMQQITIPLPPLNEQIAIANILSDLDNEITSLKNKKRQFESIKKALNHDLMSAKIRVLEK